jgi:hypothetical protein
LWRVLKVYPYKSITIHLKIDSSGICGGLVLCWRMLESARKKAVDQWLINPPGTRIDKKTAAFRRRFGSALALFVRTESGGKSINIS